MSFEQFYTFNENSNIAKSFRARKEIERAVYGDTRSKEGIKYAKSTVDTAESIIAQHRDMVQKCEQYVKTHLDLFKKSTQAKLLNVGKFMHDGNIIPISRATYKKEFNADLMSVPEIKWYVGKMDIVSMARDKPDAAIDPYGYVYTHDSSAMYLNASLLATDMREDLPVTAVHELAHCIQFKVKRYGMHIPNAGHDELWSAIMLAMNQTPKRYSEVNVIH